MEALKNWIKSYNITTHSVVAGMAFLVAAYYAVPQFHVLMVDIYKDLPGWVEEIVTAALAVYAWYRKGEPAAAGPVDGTNSIKLGS